MTLSEEQRNMLLLLSWLQLQCGQAERARTLADALLLASPGHPAGRRIRMLALLELGEGVSAERACDELLAAGEQPRALWLCIGRARQLAGRLEEAQEAFQHYLNNQDGDEYAL